MLYNVIVVDMIVVGARSSIRDSAWLNPTLAHKKALARFEDRISHQQLLPTNFASCSLEQVEEKIAVQVCVCVGGVD